MAAEAAAMGSEEEAGCLSFMLHFSFPPCADYDFPLQGWEIDSSVNTSTPEDEEDEEPFVAEAAE